LDDKKRSILILVMQRLHVNDLTGFVEDKGDFHKLSLPAIAIREESIPISDHDNHLRLVGTPLHAERDDLKTLENIKNEVGPFIFAAQYQQRPETPDGAMFHRKWINVIDRLPNHIPGGRLIISMDTAASTSATADFTAITVVYSCRDGHFVLDAERGRWDYEELLSKSIFHAKHAKQLMGIDVTFLIENASTGIPLLSTLKKGGFSCYAAGSRIDKQTRASYAIPIIHQGRLYIVNKEGGNERFEPFINELVNFPYGRFNDQVDSLVYALLWAEPKVNSQSKIYLFGGN
jgi:predicted phage terminase large subunit-like protein